MKDANGTKGCNLAKHLKPQFLFRLSSKKGLLKKVATHFTYRFNNACIFIYIYQIKQTKND